MWKGLQINKRPLEMAFVCMEWDIGERIVAMEGVWLCAALCTAAFLLLARI
jgi:hypothetical protein